MNTQEISRFVPSQDELFQLVKYWVKEAISDEWFIFWGQCFGTSDLRRIDEDWDRVAEIRAILGAERTEIAVDEAYQEYAQLGDRVRGLSFATEPAEKGQLTKNSAVSALIISNRVLPSY